MAKAKVVNLSSRLSAGDAPWADLPDDELLDWRLCDLDLRLEGSLLEARIGQVYRELEKRSIRFRPHFWLGDDWFTPDGVPGVAIPFYLIHPRLTRLERAQMLEVEGGARQECLRILRHETGHAIDNAYRLRRKKRRQSLFGRSSQPYPDYYSPRPDSKNYVLHLDSWYAQSHPDEDFAETFAEWLGSGRGWKRRYSGWPALRKLEYLDALMKEIAGRKPLVRSRRCVDPLHRARKTLRDHYHEKRERYQADFPKFYDRSLRRLFSSGATSLGRPSAASFLARVRKDIRRVVRQRTGLYQYTIDQVVEDMIVRSRELDLRLSRSEEQTTFDLAILLTVHTMHYLHIGRCRLAL